MEQLTGNKPFFRAQSQEESQDFKDIRLPTASEERALFQKVEEYFNLKVRKLLTESKNPEIKIPCFNCWKVSYRTGLTSEDIPKEFENVTKMEFVKVREFPKFYDDKGLKVRVLTEISFDYKCPVCLSTKSYMLETRDLNDEFKKFIEEYPDKIIKELTK